MTRWEYARLDLSPVSAKETDVDILNHAGENGWELIVITANNSRPIQSACTSFHRSPPNSSQATPSHPE